MKLPTTVQILGTQYRIEEGKVEENLVLETCDGYMDSSSKRIMVSDFTDSEEDADRKDDMDAYRRQVIRHEIIHAFLFESGLSNCTVSCMPWSVNEEMVDWLAIQFPKIQKAFMEVGVHES